MPSSALRTAQCFLAVAAKKSFVERDYSHPHAARGRQGVGVTFSDRVDDVGHEFVDLFRRPADESAGIERRASRFTPSKAGSAANRSSKSFGRPCCLTTAAAAWLCWRIRSCKSCRSPPAPTAAIKDSRSP